MDDLVRIPCVIMRGGTSRGPYFLASDLPSDPEERDSILISVMGSGHELEMPGSAAPVHLHSLVQPGLRQRSSLKLKPDKQNLLPSVPQEEQDEVA